MPAAHPLRSHRRFAVLMGLLSIISLMLACALLPAGLPGVGGASQGDPTAQPPSRQADNEGRAGEGPEPVAAACPNKPQQAVLFISHTFDWSPNRDKSVAEINGQTEASAPCPLTIDGDKVTAGPCMVSYGNTGVVHGSDGDCQVQGQGQAEVDIEGTCQQGVVTLTITEFPADESARGHPDLSRTDHSLCHVLSAVADDAHLSDPGRRGRCFRRCQPGPDQPVLVSQDVVAADRGAHQPAAGRVGAGPAAEANVSS